MPVSYLGKLGKWKQPSPRDVCHLCKIHQNKWTPYLTGNVVCFLAEGWAITPFQASWLLWSHLLFILCIKRWGGFLLHSSFQWVRALIFSIWFHICVQEAITKRQPFPQIIMLMKISFSFGKPCGTRIINSVASRKKHTKQSILSGFGAITPVPVISLLLCYYELI